MSTFAEVFKIAVHPDCDHAALERELAESIRIRDQTNFAKWLRLRLETMPDLLLADIMERPDQVAAILEAWRDEVIAELLETPGCPAGFDTVP